MSPTNPTTTSEITFIGLIRNAGTIASQACKAHLSLSANLFDVPTLAPGAKHSVVFKIKLDKAQNYGPIFTVDKANTVTESNEANNSKQIHFAVAALSTDLIVESFTITPLNPDNNTEITFTGVVKNTGTAPTPPSKAQFSLSTQLFDVPKLSPGARHTVTLKMKLDKDQNYGPTFTADKTNTVPESDETNNSKKIYFKVSSPTPDLTGKFTISPTSNVTPATEITLIGEVENIGKSPAPASKAKFSVSNQLYDVPPLAPHGKHTVKHKCKLIAGKNDVQFIVDCEGRIPESNESNNKWGLPIWVTSPK